MSTLATISLSKSMTTSLLEIIERGSEATEITIETTGTTETIDIKDTIKEIIKVTSMTINHTKLTQSMTTTVLELSCPLRSDIKIIIQHIVFQIK